ncbi:MAG: DASS family sodium-coupled anion symporter [Nanoarchaeota archaeon]|nr:DASS family sodium-coupled anion symporter [Nanoarchaeota archaeon]
MLKKYNYVMVIISLIVLISVYFTDIGIDFQARVVLAIMLFAAIMWIFEALPLHVTGLWAAFLLATIGGFSGSQVFNPFFDPIIALLLGGFLIAVAMQKHGLDKYMALKLVNKVGNNPKYVLLGLMCITAFLSFWITNTASTLIMIPIGLSILKLNGLQKLKSSYGKAMVLGIAFAATIGGVGTLIGSTPNLIVTRFLAEQNIVISFLDWMYFGLPLVVIMLPIIWFVLTRRFKPEIDVIKVPKHRVKMTKNERIVFIVFIITIILWLTSSIHGISASIVALIPILLLYLSGMLDTTDFGKANWSALVMFGSGLSLGSAINASGLDALIAGQFTVMFANQPIFLILWGVALLAVVLTIIASNTAAASIFIPVVIPFAAAFGLDITGLAILAAIAVSIDFVIPIGTPPSTIAYSTGFVRAKDMAQVGLFLTILASLVLTGLYFLW